MAAHLALALGAVRTPGKAAYGYGRAECVERDGITLATVFGGSSREGEVHVVITGAGCDEAVPVVRRVWPGHRVSRADAAVDFYGDFAQLDGLAESFATDRGVYAELITNSERGATRYLGGRKSEVRARLYKKTEQWRALHPERASEVPDGIVRLEVQVRPGKRDVKEAAARLDPDDLFGLAQWSRDYAGLILGLDPVRTPTVFRRPSSWTRSKYYLGQQYGPLARERAAQVGREAAAAEILDALGLGAA